MVAVESPYGEVNNNDAITALQGTWIVTAETVDYAGNVSLPSEPVRLVYPDGCAGVESWSEDGGRAALDPMPLADAADATPVADGSPESSVRGGGGCGCRIGAR
jgi:hypothetical protein